ncbi:MAG TPA: hypothetical protein VHC73_16995 [Vitreimonas sp.]|nr:hypothetical protein [Vitreimonas sp.]
MSTKRSPAFASDDWMFEQQVRAELEAEAWRRLREQLAPSQPQLAPPPQPEAKSQPAPAPARERDPHRTGSGVLKGIVRFAIAAFCAYLAWIAAMDGGLGELELWFAVGTVFIATLALSALEPARKMVHFLAETTRWALIFAFVFAVAWVLTHIPGTTA